MKLTKKNSTEEMDADNIISKMVALEKIFTKKKKRKSFNHNLDMASEGTNKKVRRSNALSVPLPMKLTFDSDEPDSDDSCNLPAPILIKKEENKKDIFSKLDRRSNKGIEVPTNEKKVKKQQSSIAMELQLENLTRRASSKKRKNSHLPIEEELDSESSVENDIPIRRNINSQLDSPKKELDTDSDSSYKEPLLTDTSSHFGVQKYNKSSNDSVSSSDEKPTIEQEKWIQTLQLQNPRLTKQVVELSLPKTHAKYSLIRVPKNISPNTLQNLKCRFEREVLNNKQYQFQPLTKRPEPMFVNLNGPRIVNLDTVIVVQKFSPMLPLNNIKVPKRENISLPDAVKARHPLFGVDYKGKIRVEKQIKKKIIEAIERKIRLEKKKKRRVKQNSNIAADEKSVLALLNLNLNTSKKKSNLFKL